MLITCTYGTHVQSCFWLRGRAQQAAAYCIVGMIVHVHGNVAHENRSSKSLHLRSSTSLSEVSENHGTDEAMDNSRSHSDCTSKPEEDRYQRSVTRL